MQRHFVVPHTHTYTHLHSSMMQHHSPFCFFWQPTNKFVESSITTNTSLFLFRSAPALSNNFVVIRGMSISSDDDGCCAIPSSETIRLLLHGRSASAHQRRWTRFVRTLDRHQEFLTVFRFQILHFEENEEGIVEEEEREYKNRGTHLSALYREMPSTLWITTTQSECCQLRVINWTSNYHLIIHFYV